MYIMSDFTQNRSYGNSCIIKQNHTCPRAVIKPTMFLTNRIQYKHAIHIIYHNLMCNVRTIASTIALKCSLNYLSMQKDINYCLIKRNLDTFSTNTSLLKPQNCYYCNYLFIVVSCIDQEISFVPLVKCYEYFIFFFTSG